MKKITLILSIVMLFSTVIFAQADSSNVTNDSDLVQQTSFLIDCVPAPKCGLPSIGFSVNGWFWESKNHYDQFHSLVPKGFRNDQKPYFMYEDNNWAVDTATNKIDVRLGETRLVKLEDESFYVHKSKRNMYHPTIDVVYCVNVQPGWFIPSMGLHFQVNMPEKIVENQEDNGYNYIGKGIKLPEDILKEFQKAFEE